MIKPIKKKFGMCVDSSLHVIESKVHALRSNTDDTKIKKSGRTLVISNLMSTMIMMTFCQLCMMSLKKLLVRNRKKLYTWTLSMVSSGLDSRKKHLDKKYP